MSKPQDERKIYGLNAALSFAHRFPDRIIRAWLSEDAAKIHFGPLMKFLAQEKRAYHIADDRELEKVTQSEHHEGVCLLVQDFALFTLEALLATLPPGKPVCLLALDGVSNPHNLGAIMRVAAHYGVAAIISEQPQLLRSGAAVRTAEGGATYTKIVTTDNLGKTLQFLKKCQFSVLATSSHQSQSVYEAPLPERIVLVLGEEQDGVSRKILQLADQRIAIAGTGWVESLNVSVATGVLLSEFWRQHRVRRPQAETPASAAAPEQARPPQTSKPNAGKPRTGKPQTSKPRAGEPRSGERPRSSAKPPAGRKPGSTKSRKAPTGKQ